jgi:hypothetical protein
MKYNQKFHAVISAMQSLKVDKMALITGNIAARMNEPTEQVGHYLQSMAKQGIIKRNGMVLDWTNNTNVKQMRWKIANDTDNKASGSASALLNVQRDQAVI